MLYIMQDGSTTTVVSYDGCVSTIEYCDDRYRVEHYDGNPFMDSNTNADLQLAWEQLDLYHIGEYATMSKALPIAVRHALPTTIADKLINLDLLSCKHNSYWFIKFGSVSDTDQLSEAQEWIIEMQRTEWEGYANEYRRESEYYVTYEKDEAQEHLLVGIADALDAVADTVVD